MNYQRIYNNICEKAKLENRSKGDNIYYEAHHIIPKCLGGIGHSYQWKTHPNIVLLTAREHFLCHLLLCEIYPKNRGLIHAFWNMCNSRNKSNQNSNIYRPSSKVYELSRKLHRDLVSLPRLDYRGDNHPNFGKKASQETREKMRLSRLGKKIGPIEKMKGGNHPRAKTIVKYSLDGEFISEYLTIVDAANSVGGSRGYVRRCYQGKKESYKGFIFKLKLT
jgi:hypothetical protein